MSTGNEIAGVVLAGGKSSRMGRDKATLPFHGCQLLDHMTGLLHAASCKDVFVSGLHAGYKCIPDNTPDQGPAIAMRHVLQELSAYGGVLFVPVDMPFLTPDSLRRLLARKDGAFFSGWPLPVYIPKRHVGSEATAVHVFLAGAGIHPIPCPEGAGDFLVNLNTPDEWKRAVEE